MFLYLFGRFSSHFHLLQIQQVHVNQIPWARILTLLIHVINRTTKAKAGGRLFPQMA